MQEEIVRWSVFPADAISVRRFFQQSVCVCEHCVNMLSHVLDRTYKTHASCSIYIYILHRIERSIYCKYVAKHNVTKSKGMFLPSWLSIVWQLAHGMSIEIHALIIFQNNKSYPAWWL